MSSFAQKDLRANQKARTREAIVEAAQQLHRGGITPTVAQAAEQARVSRATAYRYFPTQEALIVEVTGITPRVLEVDKLLENLTTEDIETRLLQLQEKFGQIVLAEEAQFRTALRVYQDIWLRSERNGDNNNGPAVREGRRMRWLDKVLESLHDNLPEEQKRRLRGALALTMGIDSIATMKDVCGLEDQEALAVLRWVAIVLLRAGLKENDTSASMP
jgi:AcrR family transcriptional regulator